MVRFEYLCKDLLEKSIYFVVQKFDSNADTAKNIN